MSAATPIVDADATASAPSGAASLEVTSTPDGAADSSPRGVFAGLRVVGLCTLASRVLGLARDVGMAALFGNGPVMDAFSVAFRIPNLFRRLFGEGALTAAFLPIFVRERERLGEEAAWETATAVLAALTVALTVLVVVGEAILGGLLVAARFSPETELLLGLTALMLPYVLFICVAAQLGAMLNALNRFAWPALVPVVLNVVWIAAIAVAPRFGPPARQAFLVSGAVVLAGFLQMLAQWPALRACGCRVRLNWPRTRTRVVEVAAAMVPVTLGLVVAQINTLADSLIAWGLAPSAGGPATIAWLGDVARPVTAGTASALYFGQRMYQFPLGIFGVALGTVMFPLFARHAELGRLDRVCADVSFGLRLVLAIGIPASAGLALIAEPLTALFFRHGAFDAADTRQTAAVIAAYATGVWAWCGLLIVTRASYAAGDRQTPLRLSVWAVGVNLALNLALVWPLGGMGLALGTSLTAMLQAIAAAWRLERNLGRLDRRGLCATGAKCLVAAAVAMAASGGLLRALPDGDSMTVRLLRVGAPLAAGILVYLAAAKALRIREVWQAVGAIDIKKG